MRAFLTVLSVGALVLGMTGAAVAGGDVAAGKAASKSCAACHGADGKGKKDNPALAGLSEADFAKAMQDYKSGARKHKTMNMLSKKLDDAKIANLAAYYASLK